MVLGGRFRRGRPCSACAGFVFSGRKGGGWCTRGPKQLTPGVACKAGIRGRTGGWGADLTTGQGNMKCLRGAGAELACVGGEIRVEFRRVGGLPLPSSTRMAPLKLAQLRNGKLCKMPFPSSTGMAPLKLRALVQSSRCDPCLSILDEDSPSSNSASFPRRHPRRPPCRCPTTPQ